MLNSPLCWRGFGETGPPPTLPVAMQIVTTLTGGDLVMGGKTASVFSFWISTLEIHPDDTLPKI